MSRTPEEVVKHFNDEQAAKKRGEDNSANNNISEQNNAIVSESDKKKSTPQGPSTNELTRDGDPNDIIKNDSNSVDSKGTDSFTPSESRGPGNDRDELNPSNDRPVTANAQDDANRRFPDGKRSIRVPNDFMAQIAVILRDAGADSRSQSTSLAKIEELVDYQDEQQVRGTIPENVNERSSQFVANDSSNLTEGNTNTREGFTGTSKVPRVNELPDKK